MNMRAYPSSVSIVMAVRNGLPWIEDQIKSIATQQLSCSWELVVADNGSIDATIETVQSLAASLPRLVLLDAREKPGKQYAQRRGILVSSGDLLVFVDHDDICAPGWLASLVETSRSFDAVGGAREVRLLNDQAAIDARPWSDVMGRDLLHIPGGIPYPMGCNWSIWRDVWQDIDDPTNDLPMWATSSEDADAGCRLARHGRSLGFAADAMVHYRLRPPGRATRRQLRSYDCALALIYKRHRDIGVRRNTLAEAIKIYLRLTPRAIKARLEHDESHWARAELAQAIGRLEGSIRCRVFYP